MHSNPCPLGLYTSRDLARSLSRTRGRSVPLDTLKRWRHSVGIGPDESYLYTQADLDVLKALVTWLSRGGRIPQFVNLLRARTQ
jgi:hypothetical protein